MNSLYYGDNLTVLRNSIVTESVDLIYLDPPFNSSATYNVLFRTPAGEQSRAQIEAFEDTWHWNESAELAFDEVVTGGYSDASIMLRAMRSALGENDMMAYLAMMAVRLIELHRVLKPTGSLYLHCDPTASHYLKVILDSIFGPSNFCNEISWRRSGRRSSIGKIFRRAHDNILFYAKEADYKFNLQYEEHDATLTDKYSQSDEGGAYQLVPLMASGKRGGVTGKPWRGFDPNERGKTGMHWITTHEKLDAYVARGLVAFPGKEGGTPRLKYYLAQNKGIPLPDFWDDIDLINSMGNESLGYPTQKPVALLERIVSASSDENDVILDPFCGCGTSIHAAQKLNRRWIGIDVTHLAIALVERRLKDAFPGITYEVHGVPKDYAGARNLAERDKYEFQKWIVATVGGQPYKSGKKGMDRGIDGYLHFRDADKKPQFGIVSVKGGENITSGMVRDLKGTMEREKAALGLFLTLNEPTREMTKEAASAGFYETGGQKIPRLQILTAEAILEGRRPQVPFGHSEGFRKAAREESDGQEKLL
jgi:site-specific DNA-methyltransferase (adenine-specific)